MWLNFVFVIKTFYVFNYKGKDTNFPEICPVSLKNKYYRLLLVVL